MPKIIEPLFSGEETSVLLRLQLGPIREWSTTLADMRRNRTTVMGAVLHPFASWRPDGNLRPLYRHADIEEFIRIVVALGIAKPSSIKGTLFEFEEPTRRYLHDWKSRTLVPNTPTLVTTPAATGLSVKVLRTPLMPKFIRMATSAPTPLLRASI